MRLGPVTSVGAAYYNEFDPAAADWLENLIVAGLIAPGHVDRRSIKEVHPDDLIGFTQHHFFAGIGGWPLAARLAGWPDARPLWTASCPCQPFSGAGKGLGTDDPRHLWPDLLRLWRAYRPVVGVGEQVAKKAGYGWFDGVRADLAQEGYASRAVDIPALAVDAPHERNRLYWVALADAEGIECGAGFREDRAERDGDFLADGDGPCLACGGTRRIGPFWPGGVSARCGNCQPLAYCAGERREVPAPGHKPAIEGPLRDNAPLRSNGSWWAGADWIICHDGKARRVADAGAPLLAHGVRGRVAVSRPAELGPAAHPEETRWVSRIAAWKGFGNAIVPPLAAEVIAALMEAIDEVPA